ncbi:hypothetical protein DOM21_02405 [Bacteriovorax stolpii]|uniref:hypothetical protein n=1 Tax=Bacteriovorax stolpii TaxID=960 RepID=UPI00115A2990|nr:hypothetical protein [Bacteriovorax stolpii]QDK40323.1 hypothetical protein DOM21_02405 [Bacteriovorax stolpii]
MKILNLLMLVLLFSCVKNNEKMSVAEMDLRLSEEWIYTTALDGLKNSGEVILRPPGFEQLVVSVTLPAKGGLNQIRQCLYYTVPYKEIAGSLKVMELKNLESCPETAERGEKILEFQGLSNLAVSFTRFKLALDFDYQKEKKKIEIPMPNIESGLVHEKYKALSERSMISGLKFLRLNDDSFDFGSNRYLGKISDRFSRGTAIRCHQVNKNCETVGENRCGDCRYGWYEVVDFQCPQGGSKFCGQNHCGEKNEPACPRGVKVVPEEEAGICQSDLEPVLNADKILVCQ